MVVPQLFPSPRALRGEGAELRSSEQRFRALVQHSSDVVTVVDADSTVRGPAGDFCRVGARRLTPAETGLVATGPHAATALRVLRNYAA